MLGFSIIIVVLQTMRVTSINDKLDNYVESKENEIEFLRDTTCYDKREKIAEIKSDHRYLVDSLESLYAEKGRIEYRSKRKPQEISDTLQQENIDVIKEQEAEIIDLEKKSREIRSEIAKCDKPQAIGETDDEEAEVKQYVATWWVAETGINTRLLNE